VKFTQLRLTGFKSFVDPTEFRIEPGLTGVIGPNGCGKSNLLEAMRWVMGATSAKSLRGSGMEDVIFSGTDARPQRERAEVVLTINNSEKRAPARFNEADTLEIIRKITRGKGSDYSVNGEDVRAKDVQLLFADAGTGANSPALVRQGQISELIAAKPENRRRVLEEAAGISGLRARRHDAELRLRGAETNLERLQEVIDETDSRCAALQKQARQAQRYRKLSSSIRALEAALWLNRWRETAEAVRRGEADLAERRETADAAVRAAAEARTKAEVEAASREPARLAEAEASAALRRLERERDILERDAAEAGAAIARLEARLEELANAATRETALAEDADEARERARAALGEINAAESGAAESLQSAEAEAQSAETARREAETELEARARDAAEARAALESARRDAEQIARRLDQINREQASAQEERDALRGSDAMTRLESAAEAADDAETAVATAKAALEKAEAARIETETAKRDAEDRLRALKADKDALEREAATLERLLAAAASDDDPALDAVRAQPGYETALAAALGDDLEASLSAGAARRWTRAASQAEALPAGAEPLINFVDAPDTLHPRLAAIGVAEDGVAAAIAARLRPGQRLVTKAGEVWRWDGLCASADAPSAAVARLEQRNRLEAIAGELEALEAPLATAQAEAAESAETLAERRQAENEIRGTIPQAERDAREAIRALTSLREKAASQAARAQALDERLDRLEVEREEADAARKAAERLIGDSSGLEAGVEALETARAAADEARRLAAEARAALEGLRREAEMRRRQRESTAREAEDWGRRCDAAGARVEEIAATRAQTETALAEARDKPETFEAKLLELTGRIETAERAAAEAREAAASTEGAVKQADTAARTAESEASAAREARAAAEARLSADKERLDEATHRLQDATGEAPGALAARIGDEYSEMFVEEIERKLESERNSRERLGAVNLRADEEAEELAAKRDEMITERDDLLAAIDKLRKGVDQLSREGRARLLEAFETVDAHFRTLFETLFEGGQAELRLTENDDPLEAGLEIYACPPGKKLDKMSLLSGGEQALTASALIFAVFLSNPAPVCVLDEVDAPLDDANVDRYCRMLDKMRRMTDTRFLIITHNPLTMSRVDRLYGVTMAERGVSQLVSVDLMAAEQLLAAE
jgi:chromosome segregation protein